MSLKDSIRYTSGKRKLRLWSSGNIAPDERTEASQCETTKISARGRGFFERGGGWIFFFFPDYWELSGRKAGDILHTSKEKKQEYKLFEGGNHVLNIVVFVVSPVTLEVFSDAHWGMELMLQKGRCLRCIGNTCARHEATVFQYIEFHIIRKVSSD